MLATMLQSRWLECQAEEPAPGMLLCESPHVRAHSKLMKTKPAQESGTRSALAAWTGKKASGAYKSTLSGFWIQGPGSIDELAPQGEQSGQACLKCRTGVSPFGQRKLRILLEISA